MPTRNSPVDDQGGLIPHQDRGADPGAQPVSPSLLLNRHIKAPPEKVFAAWTDPERIPQWFGPVDCSACRAEADVSVGGRFRIVMTQAGGDVHDVSGVYRVVTPPTLLVFTWAWQSTPERESLVTLRLRPDGDGTMLTLVHERFFDETARDNHQKGWSVILDRLAGWLA